MAIEPILYPAELSPPEDRPYLMNNSPVLESAIRAGVDGIWVSPSNIRNYPIPETLILKDIQEFLFMIQNKFTANGTELIGSKSVYEWKMKNPISYSQLILYHSLLGNYNTVRALLSIDYVERFEQLILSADDASPAEFVKSFLGDVSYNNIKIRIKLDADAGYISPSDGKLHIPIKDVVSTQPEGNGNTFGQKQIDASHAQFLDLGEIISDNTVLTTKDLNRIHVLIRDKILEEYRVIKNAFDNLKIPFLYDSVFTGSNSEESHTLENEFGIISTQDLISFEDLTEIMNRHNINASGFNNSNQDASVRGVGQGRTGSSSVFEKLVSNAELNGVQLVRLGKEKPIIEEMVERKIETSIQKLTGDGSLGVADIL